MDNSLYKDTKVSRGLHYHYLLSKPEASKPWLIFLHGFPSTSYDWKNQISFFKGRGYGLVVPDMLGYGGTDKPADPADYKPSLICQDIIDVLDAENITEAIVVGHDWGSKITARLANLHNDRFTAFAFLAVSYLPPRVDFDYEQLLAQTKQLAGYELFGYWGFFSEEGAERICSEHIDTFVDLLFPEDPKATVTDFAPTGALKSNLLADKKVSGAKWLPSEDKKYLSESLVKNGFTGPLNWYKVMTRGLDAEDNKSVSPSTYVITKPVFFGAAKQDYIALAAMGKQATEALCKNATIKEFDAGHWLIQQTPDEVNKELLTWVETLSA